MNFTRTKKIIPFYSFFPLPKQSFGKRGRGKFSRNEVVPFSKQKFWGIRNGSENIVSEMEIQKNFNFFQNNSKNLKFCTKALGGKVPKMDGDNGTTQNTYAAFEFSTEIPNLIDVQRQSFSTFVEHQMKKAFEQPLHFSTPVHDLKIIFFPEFIQFQKPEFDPKQAFVHGKTFGSSVYIPVGITSTASPALRVEWLLVGLLPLMTKQGHFVINGIPRVVLHQIIRNPGIYTIPRDSRTQTATVRIVPEKGGWINLTVDKKNRAWFATRALRRKVSLLVLLQALGVSRSDLFERIEHSELLENSYVNDLSTIKKEQDLDTLLLGKTRHDKILIRARLESHPRTQQEAWRYLYAHFIEYSPYARDEVLTDEKARDFFWNTIWNKNILVLGKIGRQQFREKVGSTEPHHEESLTVEDILGATRALLKLLYKEKLGDEIDSLTQKRIRGCDEFLFEQLLRGIKEFEVFFTRKTNALPFPKLKLFESPDSKTELGPTKKPEFETTPKQGGSFSQTKVLGANFEGIYGKGQSELKNHLEHNPLDLLWRQNKAVFAKAVSKSWKSFFTSGTLAQFMDQTNPLAETTHKRRLTVLGPGGVNSKQTTIQIRGIHPTFYGRLCPIETPEGQNAGLVNSFTVLSSLSKDFSGNLTTPFYKVYKGQVQKTLPPFIVSARQEYQFIGAPADLQLTRTHLLPQKPLPVRKELQFDYALPSQITTQSVGILQTISVATSLIPFLEHDDANRALMGSNMQRQAVPLINPQAPLVGTGLETRVICDVNHGRQAADSGYLLHVTSKKIKILTPKQERSKNFVFGTTCFATNHSGAKNRKTIDSENKSENLGSFSQNRVLRANSSRWPPKQNFGGRKGNGLKKIVFFFREGKASERKEIDEKQVFLKTEVLQKMNFRKNCGLVNGYTFFSSQNSLYQQKFTFDVKFDKPKGNLFQKTLFFRTIRQSLKQKLPRLQHKRSFFHVFHQLSSCVSEFPVEKAKEKNSKIYSLTGYQRTNQSTCLGEQPILSETGWVEKGDILADGSASSKGKLSLGKNVLIAYLPWEGYNFEDAILISQRLVDEDVFTSLHIDHYDIEVKNTQHGLEKITKALPLKIDDSTRDIFKIEKLNSQGLVEIGSWVQEGDYLVGKVSPLNPKGPSIERQYEKLYNVIMQREKTNLRNTSLRVPKGVEGFVLDVQNLPPQEPDVAALAEKDALLRVRVVLLQRRKIQVGDKMAGRHGNKGIVSNILPRQDMPYLPDGTPIDIVLNPLGVPSRMNVGQILECLLGLAGKYLQESYTTHLFDEQFGAEASRSLVYSKLYEASVKSSHPWLFEPHHPGKVKLFDGRTGIPFDQPITVGAAYILKLVHLVDDKIHARATGPYSAVTQQPVRGRSRNGGQRLGEMEVWALQAYGAAYTLHELLTLKSDDIEGRKQAVVRIYANKPLSPGRPESFKVLLRELQALCFDLQLYGTQGLRKAPTPLSLTKLENLL